MIYGGSTTEIILKMLLYKTLPYKEVERMLYQQKPHSKPTSASLRSTLYRLRKKGLLEKTANGWSVSTLAHTVLKKAGGSYKVTRHSTRRKIRTQMIVMYDIPENLRSKRDRLREGLKTLGFTQKQQSVRLGPAPLPQEFIQYVKRLGILKYINFFQVKKKDIV